MGRVVGWVVRSRGLGLINTRHATWRTSPGPGNNAKRTQKTRPNSVLRGFPGCEWSPPATREKKDNSIGAINDGHELGKGGALGQCSARVQMTGHSRNCSSNRTISMPKPIKPVTAIYANDDVIQPASPARCGGLQLVLCASDVSNFRGNACIVLRLYTSVQRDQPRDRG